MDTERVLLSLFIMATAVAILARRFRVPFTVALVITGLLLGTTHAFTAPRLTKGLLYSLFLPGLLFEAAFHLEKRLFWRNKLAILSLAVPGVAVAIAIATALLVPAIRVFASAAHFSYAPGLVFAAAIAATDPIAVVAIFRNLSAPSRLTLLLEGESLLNDGTAVVLFSIVLSMAAGEETSVPNAIFEFARMVGLGALIGAAVGILISTVIQRIHDPMVEITLTTIAAYGSFITAEGVHVSGVISTVVAGILCGNYAAQSGMRPQTRIVVEAFWEYVAFALNSLVFLLIGFEVHVDALLASWIPILIAYLAVTLSRVLVIFLVSLFLRRTRERLPWSWSAVLTWGGLRGGLSMVLILGLPQEIASRELLITMTFGVVVISILLQGLSMGAVLRALKVVGTSTARQKYEVYRGALRATQAGLRALDRFAQERLASQELLSELRTHYERARETAQEGIRGLHLEQQTLREEERSSIERELLAVEKEQLLDSLREGLIGREAFDELVRDIDARTLAFDAPAEGENSAPPKRGDERGE